MTIWPVLRSILFCLPPECAHHVTLNTLKLAAKLSLKCCFKTPPVHPVEVMGLSFPNPIGLAAGLDKNGDYIDGLGLLGFGFIEVGTVTPRPQSGNAKPRLFRLTSSNALINRMGFNNKGVDYLVERLKQRQYRGILGVNIGKNKTTPLASAVDDYVLCLEKVYPFTDYVTINISSPNTPGLRELQSQTFLTTLLKAVKSSQQSLAVLHGRFVPIVVKIAPDLSPAEVKTMAKALLTHAIDGVIATNTTIAREAIAHHRLAAQTGGLSGAPLMAPALEIVRLLDDELKGRIPIIGVGGIIEPSNASAKLAAGATLIQLYTGLIYQGPSLIQRIAKIL